MHKEATRNQRGIRIGRWIHQFIFIISVIVLSAGCETARTGETSFRPGGGGRVDSVRDGEKPQATFSGGDGSSAKQAVIIMDASGEKTGIRAEYIWLHENYPGYRLQKQTLRDINNKTYDEMSIVSADDRPYTIFFDITSFFGKD